MATSFAGGLAAIAKVGLLTRSLEQPLVLDSFGAACVLAFGFPEGPFSQPRNIIAGHFSSSLCGVAFGALFWLWLVEHGAPRGHRHCRDATDAHRAPTQLVAKALEGISLWAAMLHSWIGMQVFPHFELHGEVIAPRQWPDR